MFMNVLIGIFETVLKHEQASVAKTLLLLIKVSDERISFRT
jgi:hypothetical protein